METTILICAVTLALLAILRGELIAAARNPTPARSLTLISAAYLVGATIVQARHGTDTAAFVYSAYALNFALYLAGFFTLSGAFRLQQDPVGVKGPQSDTPTFAIAGSWVLLVVLLGAVVFALLAIGADQLLVTLYRNVALDEVGASVLELRLQLTSGDEGWLAPGYLKQLRDVLLPLATLVVLFSIKRHPISFLLLAFTLIPLVSLSIVSSGQRAPVLLFLLAAMYASARAVAWKVQPLRVVLLPALIVVLIGLGSFLALTLSFSSRYEGDINPLLNLADRIVTRGPEENFLGADLWGRGAPFPGAGWISEILMVLPGTQASLSNLLHQHIGGGERGNSVLGAWVDVHYNFGWLIGAAVSVLVGFLMALFNHWVNVSRSISRAAEICGLWISVCMLFVLSPFGFLLYGPFLISICLLGIVLAHSSLLVPFKGSVATRQYAR